MRSVHPVWWLNAALYAAAAVLLVTLAGHAPIESPHLPWFVIAAAIAACELRPVDLQFKRSSHAFSLADIPLTLALIFSTGADLMVGMAVGTAVGMSFRSMPMVKLAFNTAQGTVAAGLAATVLRGLVGDTPDFGPTLWISAFVATQFAGFVMITLIACAMRLTEGRMTAPELRQMLVFDVVITLANTSLALLAAVIIVAEPTATPIILVPVLLAFMGYRAFVQELERSEKAEFLYETTRTVSESPEVADAIEGLLERAREAFRVERAEVVLFDREDQPATRTAIGRGAGRQATEPADPASVAALRELAEEGAAFVSEPLLELLGGLRHAIAAPLRSDERTLGVMVLADRVGLSRRFDGEDLALLGKLAADAGAALRYGHTDETVVELVDLQERLVHQAQHDPLTGLVNRAGFTETVAAVSGEAMAVVFLDLDDFKSVNDTMGHLIGDRLLQAAAERISRAVRAEDLVARLGADEFAILVRGANSEAAETAAAEMVERVLAEFAMPVELGDQLLAVKLAAGITSSRHSGSDPADLLRDADMAMYEAKAGALRAAVFTPELRDAVMRRHTLKRDLDVGIDREELLVEYQPIVELQSSEPVAAEALVRWQHPEQGLIPPLEFIPLAEQSGQIVDLSRFVLRTACHRAMEWTRRGGPALTMQVNLSGRELDDPGLADHVLGQLEQSGLPPERLVIEITETALVQDATTGGAQLNRLRDHGVRLALDDFGTGFSSLSYLRSLPLDILKIAKEFTDGVHRNRDDATFVRLISELAALRGLTVIAEGIETTEQHAVLRGLGCHLGQGFLFARSLAGDDPVWTTRGRSSTPFAPSAASIGPRRATPA
jgi:diguanylate cyclase (GGDEF)-like protein